MLKVRLCRAFTEDVMCFGVVEREWGVKSASPMASIVRGSIVDGELNSANMKRKRLFLPSCW